MDHAPALRSPEAGRLRRGPGLSTSRFSPGSRVGQRRLRVVPWQGDRYVALVGPIRAGRPPTSDEIRYCLRAIYRRGVDHAVTPAMSPYEAEPFYRAGFRLFERLHLLSCPVVAAAGHRVDSPARLVAGRSWHDRSVLALDARAFRGFWRFDDLALNEAKTATPNRRYRVAKLNGRVVGYAITGRAGKRGYLQRLAVDPEVQGLNIGRQLVHDSFNWLAKRDCAMSLVNTQETNQRALGLYESIGYRRQQEGLVVLRWDKGT